VADITNSTRRCELQVESFYLSDLAFAAEICLASLMTVICLVSIFGNLFVFFAILIDPVTKKSVYQYFQMSLCLADVLMGLAGAGSGVFTQFSLLFGYLNICDFIEPDIFKASFENPVEAQKSGLNQFYFMTSKNGFVVCGAFVSLSTTVSLLLLSAMAYTRYQVATTSTAQHRVFRLATRYPVCATLLPWMIGVLFTLLYFIDIIEMRWWWQAFFDPVAKITILLPSDSNPLNFYIQTGISAIVSVLTILYSVKAWIAINENAKSVRRKGMITQQHHLMRRVTEERKWLHLTVAIIGGFIVSVVPVFVCYILWVLHVRTPPYVALIVWWLLISGSSINLVIYTSLNDSMKRSISHARRLIMFRCGMWEDTPRPGTPTERTMSTSFMSVTTRGSTLRDSTVLQRESSMLNSNPK